MRLLITLYVNRYTTILDKTAILNEVIDAMFLGLGFFLTLQIYSLHL
jgi:hypothetical protein